jgi:integrase
MTIFLKLRLFPQPARHQRMGCRPLTKIKLKHIHEFRDRHGKIRRYVRLPGRKRVPLKGAPGTEEFMAAYQAAFAGEALPVEVGASRTRPGTVNAAVVGYFNSTAFRSLSLATQITYRGILENFRSEHGDKRIALLERRHIERLIASKATTPAAANNLLRMLRVLMQFAVAEGMRRDDPTIGVKSVKVRSSGFHSGTEEEITKFEAKHQIGTRARLALALLLFTAQRRSDVIRMGRQHVRDGVLTIRQQKTGMVVDIPLHPELKEILDATVNDNLTFLVIASGKPFSPAGFTNWFRECCDAAGLPRGCSPHGLRKAAARRLAESGCSDHEIMSITGHTTLKVVSRYTAAIDRKHSNPRSPVSGDTPDGPNPEPITAVRIRLTGGGRRIRTLGPP